MRATFGAALVALVLVCALPWGAAPRARAQGDLAGQVVALVNSLRAGLGLSAWTVDSTLMAVAQNHANWMVATGQYGHTGEGGSTPQDRALAAGYAGSVAENWVAGPGMTPAGAVDWWRNSGIHYATLTSTAQHVGVGVVRGSRGTVYVLVAGRPSPPRRPVAAGEAAPEEEEDEDWPVVVPITRAEPGENGRIVHVVQQGQTAWAIAAVYKVDLDEMLRINNLVRPAVLKPGDEVIVRLGEGESPPPTPAPPTEYTIQQGQTIWEVAVTHGLTVDQLLGFNGLTREDVILPGTVLRLVPSEPGVESPPPQEGTVSVTVASESPAAPPSAAVPTDAPTDAPPDAPPAATPTVTLLPSPTLRLMPTITPAYSPTPSAQPPSGTPVALAGTAPPTLAPASAQPASSASDDEGMDEMLMVSLGVLGAVWVMVGGIGLVSYVTRRRR
ncbi:MAG: LysM peptidoglycan-binding domain-containing protein [Anaerolineae bacterium]|nr:LysM peptidoglycan-binding domain-containing protein [Anaerolineae bacterium]